MKKNLVLTALIQFFCLLAFTQDGFEQNMIDFEKMANNPNSIYGQNKAVGKYYTIRGFKMYAEVYGQGQPLLFIHGNGGSGRNFFKQVPYFLKKYKVIIADSRSQGKSADPGDSLTYEMMADDYAALLDAMNIDSAYVVGWSDGGIDGLLLAIHHPEKVKKLAITGANLRPDNTAVPQELLDLIAPAYNGLKNKTARNAEENAGYKLVRMIMEQPHIPDADLQKISCPSLVIGGDHDVIKVEHTMEIFNNIPKAYLWILPGSGHSTPIKYADEFNKKVEEFFKKPYRKFEIDQRLF
ncbi:MAG: alpha/beta hydrolase [Chitinophagaceae bacterium]